MLHTGTIALTALLLGSIIVVSNGSPRRFNYMGKEFELAGDVLLPLAGVKSGLRDERFRWPEGIVHVELDTNFTTKERATIYAGLDEIESHTCIQFKARTDQASYVFVQRGGPGSGCISELGYQGFEEGKSQVLNLEPPNCINSGIIAHEMIHGLGFWHEHMRTDRDEYVTVNYDNIDEANYKGFEKQSVEEVDDYGIVYDYSSIMHYFWNEWSVDPMIPSIVPKDPEAVLGGSILTARDVLKINSMYAKFCQQRNVGA